MKWNTSLDLNKITELTKQDPAKFEEPNRLAAVKIVPKSKQKIRKN